MAVHRLGDGFGLGGTLKSISWAWFSWGGLLGAPTFFSIGRILSPKKCFLLQGCVTHFLFPVSNNFSLALPGPLYPQSLSAGMVLSSAAKGPGPSWISERSPQVPADTCLQCPAPAFWESLL